MRRATEHEVVMPLFRRFSSGTTRGALMSLLGAVLLLTASFTLPGCDDDGRVDEAFEEVEDEAQDAKDELEDEIDDHS